MLQTIDVERIKQKIDLRDYAAHHSTLRKESSRELAGPCPKCGGSDRFHVRSDTFFCRACYPLDNGKPHDAIAYVQWKEGVDFQTACATLAGGAIPSTVGSVQRPQPKVRAEQPADWQTKASNEVRQAQRAIASRQGERGRAYLIGRGLNPATWEAFGLGYMAEVGLPGAWNAAAEAWSYPRQPAIVIPWYQGGQIRGVRYRFLTTHSYTDSKGEERENVKSKSLYGSNFAGILFGEQANVTDASAFVLCEGELNALSIWQVTKGVQVRSLGSQDAKLEPAHVEQIAGYKHILAWLDERERAKSIMSVLPGAYGAQSPRGKDANDWLQAGKLEALIVGMLERTGWSPFTEPEPAPAEAAPAEAEPALPEELAAICPPSAVVTVLPPALKLHRVAHWGVQLADRFSTVEELGEEEYRELVRANTWPRPKEAA